MILGPTFNCRENLKCDARLPCWPLFHKTWDYQTSLRVGSRAYNRGINRKGSIYKPLSQLLIFLSCTTLLQRLQD